MHITADYFSLLICKTTMARADEVFRQTLSCMRHQWTKRHIHGEAQAAKKLFESPEARPREYQDNTEKKARVANQRTPIKDTRDLPDSFVLFCS